MPTQVSNTKKATITERRSLRKTGMERAAAPIKNAMTPTPSGENLRSRSEGENSNPPSEMQHIKLAKTSPVGGNSPRTEINVGTHMNTKEYMEPSKMELTM